MTRSRFGEKKNTLTPDRVDRLKSIGFIFKALGTKEQLQFESQRRKPASDANWKKNLDLLCQYKMEYGDTLVPKKYKPNQTLSSWVYTQRNLYKRRLEESAGVGAGAGVVGYEETDNANVNQMNSLTNERIEALNSIDFVWNAKKDRVWQDKDRHEKIAKGKDLWQKYYDELVEFKCIHGHTMVPKVYKENQSMSSWVFRQRKYFRLREQGKAHSMTDERLKQLEDVSLVFVCSV